MNPTVDDHVVLVRSVRTETGRIAPPGTHGFILQVSGDPANEQYVTKLSIPNPPTTDEAELAILGAEDFRVA